MAIDLSASASTRQLGIEMPASGGLEAIEGGGWARDRAILTWVGRLGVVRLDDVRARFSLGRTVAYRRIAALIEAGLLERLRILYSEPALLRATRTGLRYAGLPLPVASISPELTRHWIACARVALCLEREHGTVVLSEREIRAAERASGRPLASAKLGEHASGQARLHRADLALVGADETVAVEVELTPKAPRRLEAIIRAWRRARWVDSVRYYARAGATIGGLERAVRRTRAADRIDVVALEALL